MIKLENTEKLTGISIIGDYYDLDNLVEAFHTITVDEFSGENSEYVEMSTRILSICYDIRHAYQGDREVILMDNNMDEYKMKYHSIVTNTKNIYYKCKCLYPEMLYTTLALNNLIDLRMQELTKKKYLPDMSIDKKVVWDKTIATIRNFQSEFALCAKELLTERQFSTWLRYMNEDSFVMYTMYHQFLDAMNVEYIHMSKEQRQKNFNKISKRIALYYEEDDYYSMKKSIDDAAKRFNCHKSEINLKDLEYPEDIEW